MGNPININEETHLLNQFNRRERVAFGRVYLHLYDDLFYFASNLYRGNEISASDVVQDVFLHLWEAEKQKFTGIVNIKAYLFISIRNGFRNYLTHKKYIEKHQREVLVTDDYFITQVIETELFSFVRDAIDLLPEECGKVFREYLNGLETKEIAQKLNKSEFTVYKQRKSAINILKQKLSKDKLLILMTIIS